MLSASRMSILGFVAAAVLLSGCGGTKSSVVAEIGKDPAKKEIVTLDEFNEVYAKNNGGKESAQAASTDDKTKFLDLYVNFKLKVKEAYERGYDKDPEIQTELQDYRRNLSVSYLMNREKFGPAHYLCMEQNMPATIGRSRTPKTGGRRFANPPGNY